MPQTTRQGSPARSGYASLSRRSSERWRHSRCGGGNSRCRRSSLFSCPVHPEEGVSPCMDWHWSSGSSASALGAFGCMPDISLARLRARRQAVDIIYGKRCSPGVSEVLALDEGLSTCGCVPSCGKAAHCSTRRLTCLNATLPSVSVSRRSKESDEQKPELNEGKAMRFLDATPKGGLLTPDRHRVLKRLRPSD